MRVDIKRDHRQTIQYIVPQDHQVLGQAELVVIDEAAAIPLPIVKNLLGPYLVFMASTINGYEGTGRSLSLKLIQQLRNQNNTSGRESTQTAVVSRDNKEKTLTYILNPVNYVKFPWTNQSDMLLVTQLKNG